MQLDAQPCCILTMEHLMAPNAVRFQTPLPEIWRSMSTCRLSGSYWHVMSRSAAGCVIAAPLMQQRLSRCRGASRAASCRIVLASFQSIILHLSGLGPRWRGAEGSQPDARRHKRILQCSGPCVAGVHDGCNVAGGGSVAVPAAAAVRACALPNARRPVHSRPGHARQPPPHL